MLTPLASFIAITLSHGDAAFEYFAGDRRRHFVDAGVAFGGAARVERAAANVDLINTSAQICGNLSARDHAKVTVGLFANEAVRSRLGNDVIALLRP